MKDLNLIVRTAKSADVCVNVIAKVVASVGPDVVRQDNPPQQTNQADNTEDGQVGAGTHRTDISITEGPTYIGAGAAYAHNAKGYMMPSPDREEKKKVLDQKLIKRSRGALQEYLERVLEKRRKKDNG